MRGWRSCNKNKKAALLQAFQSSGEHRIRTGGLPACRQDAIFCVTDVILVKVTLNILDRHEKE